MTLLDANSPRQPQEKVDAHTDRQLEETNNQADSANCVLSAYRLGAAQAHTIDKMGTIVENANDENNHQSKSAFFALATPVVSMAFRAAGRPQMALATGAACAAVAGHEYSQLVDAHKKQSEFLRPFEGFSGDVLSSAREVDNQASTVKSVTLYGVVPALALSFVPNTAAKVASLALVTGIEGYAALSAGSGKSSLDKAEKSLGKAEKFFSSV